MLVCALLWPVLPALPVLRRRHVVPACGMRSQSWRNSVWLDAIVGCALGTVCVKACCMHVAQPNRTLDLSRTSWDKLWAGLVKGQPGPQCTPSQLGPLCVIVCRIRLLSWRKSVLACGTGVLR